MIILPSKYLFSIFHTIEVYSVFLIISKPFSSNGRKLSGSMLIRFSAVSSVGRSIEGIIQRRMRYHVAIKREQGYFLDEII